MVMKRPMVAFLIQLLLAVRSLLARRARLEAENLILRQQLVVLRRKSPTRLRLWKIDPLRLVWLYRLYPTLLDDHHRPAGDRDPLAPTRFPRLLALEVSRHVGGRPRTDAEIRALIRRMNESREPTMECTADSR
jgi:hypothetical protein